MTDAQLLAELSADPAALGYARYINVSDNALAALLNASTGPGAAVITIGTQTKGAILRGIIPALDQLASGVTLANVAITPQTNTKWTQRFNALRSGDNSIALSPNMLAMFGQLVTDGLCPQAYIDAFTRRTGSRAEVLWGSDTVIAPNDVARALGRG